MLKKLISFLLVLTFLFSVSCTQGSGNSTNSENTESSNSENSSILNGKYDTENYEITSILKDKNFEKGFYVRGLGLPIYNDPIETFGDKYESRVNFCYGQNYRPDWHLCQWSSRYPFHDTENTTSEVKDGKKTFNYKYTQLSESHHLYENQSKTLEVDTDEGEIRFALKGSEGYKEDRVFGQEWPHFLIEQDLCTAAKLYKANKISTADAINVKVSVRVNDFVDHMGERDDWGLHSAMCVFYLMVANYDAEKRNFTDMLWFGLVLFDNRFEYCELMSRPDGYKESATNKWIYNLDSHDFYSPENNVYDTDGNIIYNEWKTVDVELLEHVRSAFDAAQEGGYMANSKWENLYINGMYVGFEVPGTYDLDMSIKDMDILTIRQK